MKRLEELEKLFRMHEQDIARMYAEMQSLSRKIGSGGKR